MENKKTFATITAILRRNRTNKVGENPIIIRVTKNGEVATMATEYSSLKSHWNKNNNLPNEKHPEFQEIEKYLSDTVSTIKTRMKELVAINPNCSAKDIVDFHRNYKESQEQLVSARLGHNTTVTVQQYYDLHISRLKRQGQFSTLETYKAAFAWLHKFRNMNNLPLREINLTLLKDLLAFMLDEKAKERETGGRGDFKGHTLKGYFKNYLALMSKAVDEDVISLTDSNFKKFKLSQFKIDLNPRPISLDDIDKILKLELIQGTRIWDSRNYLLFSFLGNGINFVDIAKLTKQDITGSHVGYTRSKTGATCKFKLNPLSQSIIDFYEGKTFSDYIFPIIIQAGTKEQFYHRIKTVRGDTNDDLKVIQQRCEIETNLTFYTGRHSCAKVLQDLGVPESAIGEAYGHKDLKSIKHYLVKLSNQNTDSLSDKVFQVMQRQTEEGMRTTI